MAEVIKTNRTLTELELSKNLRNDISLGENYVGDVGAEALAREAKANDKMKLLSLCKDILY